jgi:hypothetical protein
MTGRLLAALVLGFLATLASAPTAAETYWANGFIDDPDHNEVFTIPMGQINTTVNAKSSGHGVGIEGDANQVINNVSWEVWMYLSGADPNPFGAVSAPYVQTVQLDGMGEWERTYTINHSTTLTQGPNYHCRITAEIWQGGVKRDSIDHTHNFSVTF